MASVLCAAVDSRFLWRRDGLVYSRCGGSCELWCSGWLQGCVPRLLWNGHVLPALLSAHGQSQEQPGPPSCAAQWVSQNPSNLGPHAWGTLPLSPQSWSIKMITWSLERKRERELWNKTTLQINVLFVSVIYSAGLDVETVVKHRYDVDMNICRSFSLSTWWGGIVEPCGH